MQKSKSGFTIIEILVVIVVIGILASIVIVAYNGFQDRARTAQTVNAADQWLKALQIYKVRNGAFPTENSCLGENYKYNSDGAGASGVGQCRQDNGAFGITETASFFTKMQTYITGKPQPAMVSAVSSATLWYRGLYYYVAAGNMARIDFALNAGQTCPAKLGDNPLTASVTTTDNDKLCEYNIGVTNSYSFN